MATQYHEHFKFHSLEESIKNFIKIGMDIMGKKFKVEKLKFHTPKIYDITECLMLIDKDENKEGSKLFYSLWLEIGLKYSAAITGLVASEDYIHIVYARMEADEQKADYTHWITAQFDALSFMNAVPEMSQLYGLGAQKRYHKYMANKGFKKNGEVAAMAPGRTYKSKAEQEYWDMVKKNKEERASKE